VAVLVAGTIFVQRQHADIQLLGRGLSAMDAGDYQNAIPGLQKYAESHPRSAQAQFLAGQAYLQAHHPDEAIAAFQKVLQITPSAEAERGLAMAYQSKGMQTEADEAMRRANELEEKK
jgi:tetratricopeptide (TPR) repeat protein